MPYIFSMFIDSHAHITGEIFVDDLEEVLSRAEASGVLAIVNVCTDENSLNGGLSLSEKSSCVFNIAAATPHDVEREGEIIFPLVEKEAEKGNLLAVGETGLDYYYNYSNPSIQKAFLRKHIHLAMRCSLPLVIHCRDAFKDLFEILDAEYSESNRYLPTLLHCFTGSIEEAREALDRGWYISLSGIITFKKSFQLREAVKTLPLERILIETDSPYLAPQSRRGKRNEPSYLPETAQVIASIKGLSLEEVARATRKNAMDFFSLPLL